MWTRPMPDRDQDFVKPSYVPGVRRHLLRCTCHPCLGIQHGQPFEQMHLGSTIVRAGGMAQLALTCAGICVTHVHRSMLKQRASPASQHSDTALCTLHHLCLRTHPSSGPAQQHTPAAGVSTPTRLAPYYKLCWSKVCPSLSCFHSLALAHASQAAPPSPSSSPLVGRSSRCMHPQCPSSGQQRCLTRPRS